MRQGPHQKRGRGRGNRRSNTPNRNQTYDSNGPDVRIRGNASQVYEKYLNLARDAAASGDRVLAESYYQHGEHYYRILAAFQDSQGGENRGQAVPGGSRDWDQDDDDSGDERGDGGDRGNGGERGEQPGRGEQHGRGEQPGRGDRPRADQDRGGDWNRGDNRADNRADNRGDRVGRDRGDRDRNERGDRRPVRPEDVPEPRNERTAPAQPRPDSPVREPAAVPAVAEAAAAPPAEIPAEIPAAVAAAAPPVDPRSESSEADGIRRTLRLTSSRRSAAAAPEQPAAPEPAAPEPAAPEPAASGAEPERKPRRRRASPKADTGSTSEGFVAPPLIDDDGAVAAS